MFYTVKHLTQFRYSSPVSESLMEARMIPRTEGNQRCLSFDLLTSPRAQVLEYTEHTGNIVHNFNIPRRHLSLIVQAQSVIEMEPLPAFAVKLPADSWAELDRDIAEGDFWDLLVPSRFTEPTDLLQELARELKAERRDDPLTLVTELNERLYTTLEYSPLITKADSPIDEALSKRKGVCQDFAHILIALLRLANVPARYVSGYLYRSAASQHRQTEGATHAWVEAYLPRLGWWGFDPSNKMLASEEHIRVAMGRDYADVPPTKGVFKGEAESQVSVKVEVQKFEEAPRLTMDPLPEIPDELKEGPVEDASIDYILQSYRAHQLQQQQWKRV